MKLPRVYTQAEIRNLRQEQMDEASGACEWEYVKAHYSDLADEIRKRDARIFGAEMAERYPSILKRLAE